MTIEDIRKSVTVLDWFIYINGLKDSSVELPPYCIRPFVMIDMACAVTNMGVSPLLLQVINDKDEEVQINEVLPTRSAAELLTGPESLKQISLEKDLFKAREDIF